MAKVSDLLHKALRTADQQGDYWVHERHMPAAAFEELAELTRRYAWEYGEDDPERPGWRVLRSGVIGWWQEQASVDDATRRRLRYLRTDALKRLDGLGLGWKPYPRSTPLWVRAEVEPRVGSAS